MPTNIRRFNLGVSKAAKSVPAELVDFVHKKMALDLLSGVVLWAPVKTGHFRGNWQVTQVTPTLSILDRKDKTGTVTIAAGQAEIERAKPYTITWIQNNLPYSVRLTEGHSKQGSAAEFDAVLDRVAPPS